jgi:hypothetical protein
MVRPFTVTRSLAVREAQEIAQSCLRFELHDLETQIIGLHGTPLPDHLSKAATEAQHSLDKLRAALQVIAKG